MAKIAGISRIQRIKHDPKTYVKFEQTSGIFGPFRFPP